MYQNCANVSYLGGSEKDTLKFFSELLGYETIDTSTSSESKGNHGNFSVNNQTKARELLKPEEIRLLNHDDGDPNFRGYILQLVHDEYPIIDKKYWVFEHPNIKLTPIGNKDIPLYRHNEINFTNKKEIPKEQLKEFLDATDFNALANEVEFFTSEEINNQFVNAVDEQRSTEVREQVG